VPGRTVEVGLVGTTMVMTDNIDNIRAIMSTQYNDFGKGDMYRKIWSSLMRNSILTTDGQAWQTNRDHLVGHVAKIRPTDYAVTERHAQNLIRVLSDGQPHDMLDLLNRFAIDVVSDVFYGTSTSTLLSNDQSLRDAIQRHKNRNTWRNLFSGFGAMLPPDGKAYETIDKYLDSVVQNFSPEKSESREEQERKAQSLLGVLSAQGVSRGVLKDQIISVIVGGRDSVAIIITWALYELVRHPQILSELRSEISGVLGQKPPGPAQLESMDLLNSVVLETMRLHTSVGVNIRSALKDTSLPTGGGPAGTSPVGIPAGTTVIMGLDSVHRRTDLYGPDANKYNPHRWDSGRKPDTWAYFPFNRGPRSCLGKNMATMEVKFALCRLLQAFSSIELVEKVGEEVVPVDVKNSPPMKTRIAFNTKPAEIVWLRFRE
ncbi:cytochrome P450, partial [Bimuria novae-zelandiae CBS 107.79]